MPNEGADFISIFLEDTGMKEHVMKLNYPKTFKRIIVLFILLAVIAWLYKSAVNEKMNKSLWPILGIFFNIFAVMAFCIVRDKPEKA